MHKEDFITFLAKKHERPKSHYAKALQEILTGIEEQLTQGKTIHFLGFGSFQVQDRKGGTAKNFHTQQMMKYDPYRLVQFRAGELLKQAIKKLPGKSEKPAKKSNGPLDTVSKLMHKKKKQ